MKAMSNESDKNITNQETESVVDELLEKFIKLSKTDEE